jgi:enoyl-CoA hydratase/carnithine racemase
MTLQGKAFRLSAERAYHLGMVDELVEPADLMTTAESIANDICANSPHAVSLSQQAIWKSLDLGYEAATEYGWALLRMHWMHPDFKEGPMAFAEKRAPQWHVDGAG